MKRNNSRSTPGSGVGMASVLMIVTVLALTCFGLLALSSARADRASAARTENFTAAYYAAEGRLQQQLAELDAELAARDAVLEEASELVEQVREGQELVLRLEPPTDGGRYKVASCTLVNTGEWGDDEIFNLWNEED